MSERMPRQPLEAAIASAVGRGSGAHLALEEVERDGIDYDAFLAHRAVHRIRGATQLDGERVAWSLVEKVTEGPAFATPYLYDNAVRELAAYRSGLLARLAPRVRAPRLHGSQLDADGRITLWLEHLAAPSRPLDAAAVTGVARDLGGFAAAWAGRVPREPWLFTGWIDRHGQPGAIEEGLAVVRRRHPAVVESLGSRLDEIERLMLAQPRLRRELEQLPQTLCHHDAVGANVFPTAEGTVLIDWESVGPGTVGADLASLLFASVRRGDAAVQTVIEVMDDAIASYADACTGVVATEEVRRGLDAANALRWKLAVDVAASLERGEPIRRGSAPDEPPQQAMRELITLVELMLDSAARVLD